MKKVFPDAISRYKEIFDKSMELDIYIPSIGLAIEYDGMAWHKADKLEREIKKYQICQKHKIKLLRLKEKPSETDRYTADSVLSIKENMYEHKHLVAKSIDSLNWRELLVACCVPLQKNRTFYTNVLKNVVGQISFRHNTNDHAIAVWMENIRERNGLSEIPEDVQFCFRFYMRALSETINDWFLAGEKMPVEELAALMDNAMPEPLQTFLRNR